MFSSNQILGLNLKTIIIEFALSLVRFLLVELTHPDSNPTFDMDVAFTVNYSFSERRHLHRQ
jgi:hypothetical protein